MEDIIDIIVTETTNLITITSSGSDEVIDVNIIDNREDIVLNVTPSVVEININSLVGNFGVNWGQIGGTLTNQTDLNTALGLKADLVGGKVPSSQLPSYVDDVVEVANYAALPATGETGKIYVTIDTNYIYRWTGSVYVEIKDSSAVWGAITGTLSNQTDLQNALNAKFDDPIGDATQYIDGTGALQTFPVLASADKLILVVRNTSGATITKGTVVYINGASGNKPTIAKALATSDATSAQTLGIVQTNISNNSNGNVVLVGSVIDLDTSAFTEGQQLYLSGVTAGAYTATKTLAPTHLVYVGVIARAHPTQGVIEVKIQNGYELDEIHDVSITSVADNQGLFYELSTDLWKNKSIATVLGYTPADDSLVVKLAGSQTITGVKTFTGGIIANVTTGVDQGFASTNTSTSDPSIFLQNNSAIAMGMIVNNSTTGDGIYLSNDTSGRALYISNSTLSGSGKGISIDNYNGGIGIEVGSDSSADAIKVLHISGRAFNIQSSGGGYGVIINNTTASTSSPFTIQKQGATVISMTDAGAITGTSFVKTGGTSAQFLKADGSVDSSVYLTTGTASSTYLPLSGGTLTGELNASGIKIDGDPLPYIMSTLAGADLNIQFPVGQKLSINDNGATNVAYFGKTEHRLLINGSIALTVNSGGTSLNGALVGTTANFSGALSGTSASFSGNITAKTSIALSNNGAEAPILSITSNFADGYRATLRINNTHTGGKQWDLYSTNNGDGGYGGGKLAFVNVTDSVNALILASTGAATFSSSITADGLFKSNQGIFQVFAAGTFRGGLYNYASSSGSGTDYSVTLNSETGLYFTTGGSATQKMVITSAGNVGINTSSGFNQISGTETTLKIANSNAASLYLEVTGVRAYANYVGANGSLVWYDITAATPRMTITSGGNVLVGTTSDVGARLHVSGNLVASGTSSGNGLLSRDNTNTTTYGFVNNGSGSLTLTNSGVANVGSFNMSTGVYTPTSDINKKKDFEDSTIGLNEVLQLKPTLYRMKTDKTKGQKELGFIAQEVKDIIPNAYVDNGDFIGLNFNPIVAALTKAVQELSDKITTLENK
jgi:hypothetical protein